MEILIASVVILFILSSYLSFQYVKIRKVVNELNKPLRKGYYKENLVVTSSEDVEKEHFVSVVYVVELDRYTSGESKIKIDYIEPGISEHKMSKERILSHIKQNFVSVVKTADINWLDRELAIKEMRKEKLSKIKKHLK